MDRQDIAKKTAGLARKNDRFDILYLPGLFLVWSMPAALIVPINNAKPGHPLGPLDPFWTVVSILVALYFFGARAYHVGLMRKLEDAWTAYYKDSVWITPAGETVTVFEASGSGRTLSARYADGTSQDFAIDDLDTRSGEEALKAGLGKPAMTELRSYAKSRWRTRDGRVGIVRACWSSRIGEDSQWDKWVNLRLDSGTVEKVAAEAVYPVEGPAPAATSGDTAITDIQRLTIAEDLVGPTTAGLKKNTIRAGRRDIVTGPLRLVPSGDLFSPFDVEVTGVTHTTAKNITDADIRANGFANREAMIEGMKRFYHGFDLQSEVTVVTWA